MTITSSLSLWEWRKEKYLFLFPQCIRITHPVFRGLNYSHKKMHICPILKKLDTDVTTTREMVEIMETKYSKANRVWILDRGMVSEDNLEFMRCSGARYLVGTSKSRLKKFEQQLVEKNWEEAAPGVEVRLCPSPEGADETFVLCRSLGRKEKENAILNRFVVREAREAGRTGSHRENTG